jgi:hypothetical protein
MPLNGPVIDTFHARIGCNLVSARRVLDGVEACQLVYRGSLFIPPL